jgi:hypothetical protein
MSQAVANPLTASQQMLALLSAPRIDPYRVHFKPASDDELLGAYMWAQAVCSRRAAWRGQRCQGRLWSWAPPPLHRQGKPRMRLAPRNTRLIPEIQSMVVRP